MKQKHRCKQKSQQSTTSQTLCSQQELLLLCLQKQKKRLHDQQFQIKLSFTLHCEDRENIERQLKILAQTAKIAEEVLMAGQLKRTVHYLCILTQCIDMLMQETEREFERIRRSFP